MTRKTLADPQLHTEQRWGAKHSSLCAAAMAPESFKYEGLAQNKTQTNGDRQIWERQQTPENENSEKLKAARIAAESALVVVIKMSRAAVNCKRQQTNNGNDKRVRETADGEYSKKCCLK